MIGFYLNASTKIGLGHFNRCLLIFKLIKKKSLFLTESKKLKKILLKKKINFCFLKNAKNLSKIFINNKIKILIIDLQYFNKNITEFLKKNKEIFVVVLSDKHKRVKEANLTFFPEITKKKKQNIFSGKKYVLVPKFPKKKKINKVQNIMISMGGSDPHNITKKVATLISGIDVDIKLNIVLGKFYKFKKNSIRSALKKSIKYKIYDKQKNLKSLMLKNDLLITNSGITKYEAFSMKMPSIIISNSAESNLDQKNFSSLGGSIFIGDFNSKKLNNLKKIILKLIINRKIIWQMQKSCKNYFDGYGAERILKIINYEYKKNFKDN